MEKSSWPWGPEKDLLRVRIGLEWVVELLCSLLNRNVASFSTAQARPGQGGGHYPVGDEGHRPPSLGEARSTWAREWPQNQQIMEHPEHF